MSVNAYIHFNGNCREAVKYYAKVFQKKEPKWLTFGEVHDDPAFPMPEAAKNLIMHTELELFGSRVMFSDTFPGMTVQVGNHIGLAIVSGDYAEIQRCFHLLKEEGDVEMELQETTWSRCYGALIDRFGVHWQFNYVD